DLVSVTWKFAKRNQPARHSAAEIFISESTHILRAFELKLSDWRKALQQASRYRFFAHVPIAVLPATKSRSALENLGIFRTLGVGLWTFDPKADIIKAHFSPLPRAPRDTKHHTRIVCLLAKVTKALPVA